MHFFFHIPVQMKKKNQQNPFSSSKYLCTILKIIKKDQIPHYWNLGRINKLIIILYLGTCINQDSEQNYQQVQKYTCCSASPNQGQGNQLQEMAQHIRNEGFPPPWGGERGQDENEFKRKAFYWPEVYVCSLQMSVT